MSARTVRWIVLTAAVAVFGGLTACGEKPQEGAKVAKKADGKAWEGAKPAYTAEGWKPGDRESWEQQLKARNQQQNEYSRTR